MKQVKLGISGATTMPYDLFTEIEVLGKSGVRYLEVWKDKLLKVEVSGKLGELKNFADDKGVVLYDINSLGDASLPDSVEDKLEECRRLCDLANRIGAEMITVCPSFIEGEHQREALLDRSAENLFKLSEVAKEFDVKLAFEFLYFSKSSVRTLGDSRKLVERVGSRHLGLLVDSAHLFLGGSSLRELESTPGDLIFLVHIDDIRKTEGEPRDEDRVMPGDGILPLKEYLKTVLMTGYDGPIMVEIFNEELWKKDVEAIVMEAIEKFQRLETEVEE